MHLIVTAATVPGRQVGRNRSRSSERQDTLYSGDKVWMKRTTIAIRPKSLPSTRNQIRTPGGFRSKDDPCFVSIKSLTIRADAWGYVLAGVRAGAEKCEDRVDGSELCWIPVWERLPPAK
jgi:hypothetical protein